MKIEVRPAGKYPGETMTYMDDKPCTEWTHDDHMRYGAHLGWWKRWDEKGPFKDITLRMADFESDATMAHVMVLAEQFKSLTEARSAGWNKPMTLGEHMLKKRRVIVTLI